MSEVLKVSYRSIGGFFALIFMFVFLMTGFSLFLAGIVLMVIVVVILLQPDLLADFPIKIGANYRVLDPVTAIALLSIIFVILIALGTAFVLLAIYTGKGAMVLDRNLSQMVDKNVPRMKDLRNNKKLDRLSQLERLTSLHERGALTNAEYEQEKALILKQYS